MTLPVNEIFATIQGEGHHTGRPSIFIRLQGCPVGCPWCDTKFTWEKNETDRVEIGRMLTKDQSGSPAWAAMSVGQICAQVGLHRPTHIVLTGGEPTQYDLTELTTELNIAGRSTQIETSGTFPIKASPQTWVTLSPKFDMPGGLPVRADAIMRANEIKMAVGKADDIFALHRMLERSLHRHEAPIYLQPLSLSRTATDICTINAIANGWRVSTQVHRLAGWR